MKFNIFTLYPQLFESFFSTSLIARGLNQNILSTEFINWREKYGAGNHKQLDDRAFGGGSGMVLQPDPILQALADKQSISRFFSPPDYPTEHKKILPNNIRFYKAWLRESGLLSQLAAQTGLHKQKRSTKDNHPKRVTISLTPRGFPFTQHVAEWLATFDEISLLCGRFEGFDVRVDEAVDVELSLGNFVLNGGEVAAMAVIESVSRLLPGFVEKSDSIAHDSFSSSLNIYQEQAEFSKITQPKQIQKHKKDVEVFTSIEQLEQHLVDDIFPLDNWLTHILPQIEHPQYTRPEVWKNWAIPAVLKSGDHKRIQTWRVNWYSDEELEFEKSIKS